MSLDLKDERVVFVAKLPVRVGLVDLSWHSTTDLHGRLIFVVCSNELKRGKTLKRIKVDERTNDLKQYFIVDRVMFHKCVCHVQMWMLDDGRRNKTRPEWVLRCKLVEPEQELPQGIAWPHVTHGEHILTTRQMGWMYRVSLHACLLSKARKKRGRVVRAPEAWQGGAGAGLAIDRHAPTSLFSLLLELLCPPAVLLAMLERQAPLHHRAAAPRFGRQARAAATPHRRCHRAWLLLCLMDGGGDEPRCRHVLLDHQIDDLRLPRSAAMDFGEEPQRGGDRGVHMLQ
ncbi:hypothetical protein HU200_065715 [Digitaria exilis]|uniref:Uncharacterized protein n=1 Tax=Digitaria exilis TaxID=1010633 RepID=A0A835DTI4_9POAL|nr:hypothetical protein HU200_065715 [Digitaria exilis]